MEATFNCRAAQKLGQPSQLARRPFGPRIVLHRSFNPEKAAEYSVKCSGRRSGPGKLMPPALELSLPILKLTSLTVKETLYGI